MDGCSLQFGLEAFDEIFIGIVLVEGGEFHPAFVKMVL
jgi:hypothetical protein